MTVTTPAGWYPNPDGSRSMRYWDGSAWTEHHASGPPLATSSQKLRPGLVGVWITAVLSLTTFFLSYGTPGSVTRIALPIGVGFMVLCWHLVGKARDEARRRSVELPAGYRGARITSAVLASLSLLSCVVTMVAS